MKNVSGKFTAYRTRQGKSILVNDTYSVSAIRDFLISEIFELKNKNKKLREENRHFKKIIDASRDHGEFACSYCGHNADWKAASTKCKKCSKYFSKFVRKTEKPNKTK